MTTNQATDAKAPNERLIEAMQEAGFTNTTLAAKVGTSASRVSGWRAGEKPHQAMRPRIARALKVDEEALW